MMEAELYGESTQGYVGKEGKAPALWWDNERMAQKELDDATLYGDDDVEVARLMSFYTSLLPQLKVKKSGGYLRKFQKRANEVGFFGLEEISIEDYRDLFSILEEYLTELDAHQGDHRGDKSSNTRGIPPEWLGVQKRIHVTLNPAAWFKKGLATIITGENGSGKTNLIAWIILQILIEDNPYGLRPVVATNVKFYQDWIDDYGIRKIRTLSHIFDVVAEIDLAGERRNMYIFIDEFDGAEGQNAWETHGKEAAAAFRVFNQMRKLHEIIFVPAIHFAQDVNSRWRKHLDGVYCVLNKGKYYKPQGTKGVWDCAKIKDDMLTLKSMGIWWKDTPINLQCVPDVGECFETYGNTSFRFDMTPWETGKLMDAIDRIPMPQHGSEEERLEWLIQRGEVIQGYMAEWRDNKSKKKSEREEKAAGVEFRRQMIEEAYTKHYENKWTYQKILDEWENEFSDDDLFEYLPGNIDTLAKAVNRYKGRIGGKGT